MRSSLSASRGWLCLLATSALLLMFASIAVAPSATYAGPAILGAGGIWNAGYVKTYNNSMSGETIANPHVQVFRTGTCQSGCSTYTNEAHDTDGYVFASYGNSTAYTKCKNYGTVNYYGYCDWLGNP